MEAAEAAPRVDVIHDPLHLRVDQLPPQRGAEQQPVLGAPVVRNVHHVDAQVDAVPGEADVPLRSPAVQLPELLRIEGQVQQLVFDAEDAVEIFKKARRLHVAEALPLLVEGDAFADVLVGAGPVRIGEEVFAGQQVGRQFFVFRAQPVQEVLPERAGAAENVAQVEFVMVLERRHGAEFRRDLVRQVCGDPPVDRLPVRRFSEDGIPHPLRAVHALSLRASVAFSVSYHTFS